MSKSDVGLGNVDNTADINKPISTATQAALNNKVDKVTGKGLSTNDYTTADKEKLASIEAGAKNYTLPRAGANVGGVLSGGDVTITDGIIIVKDDSHNHTIDNVDGLQSALDGKSSTGHTHSKSDVGLGNVPNVATNDQTPTHTMASSLTKLTSGEKISVAFGKIAKAINDLISHISNTSNPHSVNKSQVGLGSVDNTSDADKPISTAQATAIADAKKAGTDAQSSVSNHIADKSNPHGVNKTQVGLGNVPNVATNDQTPTYTEASNLTKLTSGEKISIALGKIAKAINDLISHIGNKSNPHGVTKSQVGLGNVDNTSDANKPVSTAQATAIEEARSVGTQALTMINTHNADKSNPHGVTPSQIGAVACTTNMTFSVDANGILTITY